MIRLAALAALVLAAFASSAVAAPTRTTARVIDIVPADNGAASVALEIGGILVKARLGDGEVALERGQVAQIAIHRNDKRQWVVSGIKPQVVASN